MSHKAADRIRNVALIGHRDCGKTSLAEAMLYEAGAINRLGRTETGNTVSDFEPDEQERGMSIGASICSFEHGDRKINLIDTPGDPSFVAEALGALAVADAAVVVVSAVDG
ncbi:MAG: GTP-binding protein, partial [Solirubrobacterales bacterium]|nr:GTP-binding protein [Solirubrobacterales bacterium]